MLSNPFSRAQRNVSRVISSDCTRLIASCTCGLKSCTPKLVRLNPTSLSAAM